jgi:hypothetical protein
MHVVTEPICATTEVFGTLVSVPGMDCGMLLEWAAAADARTSTQPDPWGHLVWG